MGLFTPKYPKSDTPGADAQPARRESRGDRRDREANEAREARTKRLDDDFKRLDRESKERSARFWERYEKDNGPGSVDW